MGTTMCIFMKCRRDLGSPAGGKGASLTRLFYLAGRTHMDPPMGSCLRSSMCLLTAIST